MTTDLASPGPLGPVSPCDLADGLGLLFHEVLALVLRPGRAEQPPSAARTAGPRCGGRRLGVLHQCLRDRAQKLHALFPLTSHLPARDTWAHPTSPSDTVGAAAGGLSGRMPGGGLARG